MLARRIPQLPRYRRTLVSFTQHGDVGHIRMDDDKMNSFSFALMAEFNEALDAAAGCKSVVLEGNAKAFSAGFDLGVMGGEDKQAKIDLIAAGGQLALRVFTFPRPVIAACTGHALAQGACMLLASDIRIGQAGNPKTKIGLNETKIGVRIPIYMYEMARASIAPPMLSRCISQGELFNPEQAVGAGYLDAVSDAVVTEAMVRAERAATELKDPTFTQNKELERGPAAAFIQSTLPADIVRVVEDLNLS